MKRLLIVLLLIMLCTPATAAEKYLQTDCIKKAGRGFANVFTSPLEIPKELKKHFEESGNHPIKKTVVMFGGLVKGTANFVGRLGSGLWDIVTCNLDIPAGNEPLMKPDYVFDADEE